jgi:hypothetical protein
MILLSHRGNLVGRNQTFENHPNYISAAIRKGFQCEIDIWSINDMLYSGHDGPRYAISKSWLFARKRKLYIHAKNVDALKFVHDCGFACFWQDKDDFAIVNNGTIMCHSKILHKVPDMEQFIAVLPDMKRYFYDRHNTGICSDHIQYVAESIRKDRG